MPMFSNPAVPIGTGPTFHHLGCDEYHQHTPPQCCSSLCWCHEEYMSHHEAAKHEGSYISCSGCAAMRIKDPRERALRLVDLFIASGGYDYWGPLEEALKEAAKNVRERKSST